MATVRSRRVSVAVDLTHAAGADEGGDVVVAEAGADFEGHGWLRICCVYPFPSGVPLDLSCASLSSRNLRMSSAASRSFVHCSL